MKSGIECPNCGTIFYATAPEEAEMILDNHLDNCREPKREDDDA